MMDDEVREEINDLGDLGKDVLRSEFFARMTQEAEDVESRAVDALVSLVTRPLEGGELLENRYIQAATVGYKRRSLRDYIAAPGEWVEAQRELREEEATLLVEEEKKEKLV